MHLNLTFNEVISETKDRLHISVDCSRTFCLESHPDPVRVLHNEHIPRQHLLPRFAAFAASDSSDAAASAAAAAFAAVATTLAAYPSASTQPVI